MNRKTFPVVLMLVAGAITCIITYMNEYSIMGKLIALFISLLVFYILGNILRCTLDYFDKQNEKRLSDEGEVIEKESEVESD